MITSRILTVAAASVLASCSNLTWVGPKTYVPPMVNQITVENLGVDDEVDILVPNLTGLTVSRTITNEGFLGAAPAGYTIDETIVRWVFQAVAGSAGWVPGDPATHTVYSASVAGPALASGASAPVSFGPVPPLPCGLYQQTMTIDSGVAVTESDEGDNVAERFFFVPSTQQFNIDVAAINPTITHDAGPIITHTFTVNPAGATAWVYGHFSSVATEGSTAATMPAPPANGGPAPQVITMTVTPQEHTIPGGFQPTVTGKVTVISQDGCVVKQETARVLVEHQVN
jgi:hypothetical protein